MGRFLRHAFALSVLLFVLLPFLWMAYAAFMPKEAVYSGELFSRVGFSLENVRALAREGFWGRLLFSLGVSFGAVALELFTALFAAYALRAGLGLLPFYLVLMAIPAELLLVPLYGVLKDLSLLETFWALLLPFAASPFVIYLVYQGMRAVPEELLEAAKLDGAGHRVLLFRILLPLVRPTLVAAGVLAFAAHWNLVLYPRVVVSDPGLWTLQTWLTDLQRKYPTDWGLLSAAALLSVLPIALLYLLFERRVVATFEEGLKG
ncbi:binding-protein-dependent transport system inner membrane protein [Thermus thermophilus]|uniref:carbohydrate ABC transporter permease n=1 Tax=Thermus thermophilus TaxID=274 RepID=UPI00090B772E|nr:carbohydrate ABC transporter permease [Thermus thermophilus]BAW01900.1 binding-protein-dependent transport system inner membrane protein [Thermus thermophilus]BDB12487.1 ABC transporter permease [Thermus thermophilus]